MFPDRPASPETTAQNAGVARWTALLILR
jgi:hypothetical protein